MYVACTWKELKHSLYAAKEHVCYFSPRQHDTHRHKLQGETNLTAYWDAFYKMCPIRLIILLKCILKATFVANTFNYSHSLKSLISLQVPLTEA